jgi:cell wall-associated NlpC family hydrolase
MIRAADYLRLRFARGGRDRPAVDCWGLYRLLLGEHLGIWLPDYEGVESAVLVARTLAREQAGRTWQPVPTGEERAFDLVLMRGMVGEGRATVMAPQHVGCVIEPGRMIDIEETTGVMVRPYRDTARWSALPTLRHRVIGVFRPEALA